MKTIFLFSSEKGDVPVESRMLQRPFVVRPMEEHPFLTLGDFFSAIRDFLLDGNGVHLKELMKWGGGKALSFEEIKRVIIRYEKYGILYHILSIEVESNEFSNKYALSAAQLPEAKKALKKEFELLSYLNQKFDSAYIQQTCKATTISISRGHDTETFLIMLSKWFEGYHEWHFTGEKDNAEKAVIWDMELGYRHISQKEIEKIIFKASKILTLFYDPAAFNRIYPWHHGAGDFIVKNDGEESDVRLISVRGYEPLDQFLNIKNLAPVNAIVFFLIEMSIKMRIDKYEGMGDPVWAGNFLLNSILGGFIEAIRLREEKGDFPGFSEEDVIDQLKCISEQGLRSLYLNYLKAYRIADPVDFNLFENHSEEHIVDLYHVIQSYK